MFNVCLCTSHICNLPWNWPLIFCFRQRLKYIYIYVCMFCLPVVSFSLWLFWKTCPTIKPIFLRIAPHWLRKYLFLIHGMVAFFTWDERFTLHGLSFINFKICTAAYYPILKIWIWMNLSAPSFGWLVGWLIDWLIVCVYLLKRSKTCILRLCLTCCFLVCWWGLLCRF